MEAEEMRRRAYAKEEEKRRQDEQRHEQNMQFMFFSFMQQAFGMRSGGQGMSSSLPAQPPYTTPPATHQQPLYPTSPEDLPCAPSYPFDESSPPS